MSGPRTAALAGLGAALAVLAACDPGQVSMGTEPWPDLVPLDSVELREPASAPMGRPGALAALDDGGYLVADLLASRVVEYDATGKVRTSECRWIEAGPA